MKKETIIGLIVIFVLNGCYSIMSKVVREEYSTEIYSEKKSKSGYTHIRKIINSHCGCSDAIAEYYVGRRIVYRFYYGCSIYKTKKEYYNYCSRGALIGHKSYEGTEQEGTDYKTRLGTWDKFVLHKIDSFIQTEKYQDLGAYKLCEKKINGLKLITENQ